MEPDIYNLVQAIHDAPPRLVMVTAGAGAQALGWLLGVAGASRTLIEALVPYDPAAFDNFLGQTPSQYVAADTAALLAGRALTRGCWLRPGQTLIGLSCTATIATDRQKRGEHRAYTATWKPDRVTWHTLHLEKGARDRAGEEELVSRAILNTLAQAYGLGAPLALPLGPGDSARQEESDLAAPAASLHQGHIGWFGIQADGHLWQTPPDGYVLLSGAFNPLHDGHLGLAQAAAEMAGRPAVFELAAVNADKPPLPPAVTLDRMAQFAGRWPVFATNAPTFDKKARLFPETIFAVGYDTAVRVLQPHYYGGQEQMETALAEIRRQGCSFLVAGRASSTGQFHDASQLDAPAPFADLFQPIPATDFRLDLSSTQLRATGGRGSR